MAGRDCACGCLAVRLARVCGLSLQPIGCTFALACDVQCYCSCSCRLWRYTSVMPLLYLFSDVTACVGILYWRGILPLAFHTVLSVGRRLAALCTGCWTLLHKSDWASSSISIASLLCVLSFELQHYKPVSVLFHSGFSYWSRAADEVGQLSG